MEHGVTRVYFFGGRFSTLRRCAVTRCIRYHVTKSPIMSLRNLQILTAVARKGSFAAAAEHLGLTQSAVSLQIKNLEEELGVQLFERTGRSPRLNSNGRLVVERAVEILAIYDGIRDELAPSRQMGGDHDSMSAIITVQTCLSFFTLPLTIWLLM